MDKYEKIVNLLMMPSWGNTDIQSYLELCQTPACIHKVIKLRKQAEINGGAVPYKLSRVKVDYVLNLFGKNREQEISMLTQIINAINKERSDANNTNNY